MELRQLIEARTETQAVDDAVTKLLAEIERLDAKRSENLFRLREKADQLERQLPGRSAEEDVRNWLESYRRMIDAEVVERRDQFGAQLDNGLAPLGIKLRGQYPRLNAGFFTLQLNFDQGRCKLWYGPEQEELAEITLEAGKVADAIRSHRNSLGSSGFELSDLSARMLQAYRHARLDCPDGRSVSLVSVLPYMALSVQGTHFRSDPRKERYREYNRADFSYDLYRLREAAPPFRLIIATRQQTQRRSDFLWIPSREDVEGGNYFSVMDVKEDKS